MNQHNLPTLTYAVIFLGTLISIAGFFLFLIWKERHKKNGKRKINEFGKDHTRRKVKGRKRYK
jgi:hypothetical protein